MLCQGRCEIRALVAGVQGCPATVPAGPDPYEIARLLPPLLSGRRTYDRLCPTSRRIFRRARPRRNAELGSLAGSLRSRGNGFRGLRLIAHVIVDECFATCCREPPPVLARA